MVSLRHKSRAVAVLFKSKLRYDGKVYDTDLLRVPTGRRQSSCQSWTSSSTSLRNWRFNQQKNSVPPKQWDKPLLLAETAWQLCNLRTKNFCADVPLRNYSLTANKFEDVTTWTQHSTAFTPTKFSECSAQRTNTATGLIALILACSPE